MYYLPEQIEEAPSVVLEVQISVAGIEGQGRTVRLRASRRAGPVTRSQPVFKHCSAKGQRTYQYQTTRAGVM